LANALSQSTIGELPPIDHDVLDAANDLFRTIVGNQAFSR